MAFTVRLAYGFFFEEGLAPHGSEWWLWLQAQGLEAFFPAEALSYDEHQRVDYIHDYHSAEYDEQSRLCYIEEFHYLVERCEPEIWHLNAPIGDTGHSGGEGYFVRESVVVVAQYGQEDSPHHLCLRHLPRVMPHWDGLLRRFGATWNIREDPAWHVVVEEWY